MASSADPIASPPLSSDDGPSIIIVVFVSLGCIFFLGVLCLFTFWFLIKRKKKETVQETEIIRDDEHLKVKEGVVKGPFGSEAVVLSIEGDKHLEEVIMKSEKEVEGKFMHGRKSGEISRSDHCVEVGESSSSNPGVHHVEYKS